MKFKIDRIKQVEDSHKIVCNAIEDLYQIYYIYNADEIARKKSKQNRPNRLFQDDPQKISNPEVMIRLMNVAQNLKIARQLTFLNGEFSRPKKEEKKND